MSSTAAFCLLSTLGGYLVTSFLLLKYPALLHQRKKQRFLCRHISHRGGAGENLENTMTAFQHAVTIGTDMLELDCHITKDEQVVVSHDANLKRSTGVNVNVSDLKYCVREKPEADRNPPVLYHNSRARSTGACNCGRKQAPRDDPFDIKAANYDFYQLLEEKCCGKLDHINFPVFEPSTPDPAPAKNEPSPAPPDSDAEKLKEKEPQTQGESTSLSLALSLGQSTDSLGTYPADPQAGGDNPEVHGQGEVKSEKRPNLVDRQASTVEYLPGMLHSNCPKGLLPKFSSWSLVKLGPAKSYNFHTGLDQQGFVPGTNYLMPWDIVIRTRAEDEGDLDTNSWPAPNKAVPGKRSAVVMGRGRRRDDIARAFVGFEYEDSRGRRFMCSGPDKVMKVMGSGPKESALKALNSDMPLYILSSSQGRGLKPHYAQLMRLFVVVPDAPLQIILMPQVQPGPPPCPVFYPEKQEITLPPDGLWVLRFPYAYVTERGPCFPPKENVQLMSYKVLRGVLKAVTQ